jgi:hypothetical protein
MKIPEIVREKIKYILEERKVVCRDLKNKTDRIEADVAVSRGEIKQMEEEIRQMEEFLEGR